MLVFGNASRIPVAQEVPPPEKQQVELPSTSPVWREIKEGLEVTSCTLVKMAPSRDDGIEKDVPRCS